MNTMFKRKLHVAYCNGPQRTWCTSLWCVVIWGLFHWVWGKQQHNNSNEYIENW